MDHMFDFAKARWIVLQSAPAMDRNRKLVMALAAPYAKLLAMGGRMLL